MSRAKAENPGVFVYVVAFRPIAPTSHPAIVRSPTGDVAMIRENVTLSQNFLPLHSKI